MSRRHYVHCMCIEYADSCLHPDDRHLRRRILDRRNGVYEHLGIVDGYERLRAGDIVFRVADGNTRNMKAGPAFAVGDVVRTRPPRSPRVARIRQVAPHLGRRVPIYFLDLTGRRKWSWFDEEHLELLDVEAGGVAPRVS